MKRLFIATKPPHKLRTKIFEELIQPLENAKKICEENLHITIRFIGKVNEKEEKETITKLEKINFNEFKTKLSGIGHFNKRVLWVGVKSHMLEELSENICTALGARSEKNQHPTIARTRENTNFEEEYAKIKNKTINEEFSIDKFIL